MRQWSEEQRSGTLEVLLTAPVTEFQVVLGKFLGSFLFYLFLWAPTLVYVVILSRHSRLDWGPVAAGYLGVVLLGAMFLSMGLLTSALVRNQIVAAVFAFALLVVVFSFGLVEGLVTDPVLKAVLSHMNLWDHMDDFSRGLVDTRRVVYQLSVTGLFLFLATKALEAGKGR
jgi:ABC-2 type transport system permease protein